MCFVTISEVAMQNNCYCAFVVGVDVSTCVYMYAFTMCFFLIYIHRFTIYMYMNVITDDILQREASAPISIP